MAGQSESQNLTNMQACKWNEWAISWEQGDLFTFRNDHAVMELPLQVMEGFCSVNISKKSWRIDLRLFLIYTNMKYMLYSSVWLIEIIVDLILIALHFLNKIFILIIVVFCSPLKNRKIGKRNLFQQPAWMCAALFEEWNGKIFSYQIKSSPLYMN